MLFSFCLSVFVYLQDKLLNCENIQQIMEIMDDVS